MTRKMPEKIYAAELDAAPWHEGPDTDKVWWEECESGRGTCYVREDVVTRMIEILLEEVLGKKRS